MPDDQHPDAALLTPAQAAEALQVAPRTVARWSDSGRILALRTPGGHRRYREIDVRELSEREDAAAIDLRATTVSESARRSP